ncbi:MAG TPA: YdcH family protein [Sphingomicrobium sp.]|nr:YdcH family protein [Sphingomicrobium sp.]
MATNDDDLRQLLETLRAEHRRLDDEIAALEADGRAPQLEVARLKKRKLVLKDEIVAIGNRIVPDILA